MAESERTVKSVNEVLQMFEISDESLIKIKGFIAAELELGLSDEEKATIKMLITYVRELARGDEYGSYLALDLGGTHFRVLLVEFYKDGKIKVTTAVHTIPDDMLLTPNGQELFDYIALKLLEFVQQYKLKRRRISLGFTFSFPCKQYGLTQSVLVKWCKGFNVGGVVGTDVVKQLKDALKRQLAGLVEAYIDVVAVINDTTGTLVACAKINRDCRIGLIVGTGFNACYMERLDKCEKWPANYTNPKQVIINCEWGAMGDNKTKREFDPYRNEFDRQIDEESVNPHNQTYEKMVSGMYIGELLRLSMLKLYKSKLLFAEKTPTMDPSTSTKSQSRKNVLSASNEKSNNSVASSQREDFCNTRSTSQSSHNGKSRSKSSERSPRLQQANGLSNSNNKLNVKNILDGRHLSMIAKDELNESFDETLKIMKHLRVESYTESDLLTVRHLGSRIMHRGAHLVACGISVLLERMRRAHSVIGYDGSVIKYHPYFLKRLVDKCAKLTPKEYKFDFEQSSDGSGIGAAVVAAALHKERRPIYVVKPGKVYVLASEMNTPTASN